MDTTKMNKWKVMTVMAVILAIWGVSQDNLLAMILPILWVGFNAEMDSKYE